ncbi:MBL fold metallo-hydrolase [Actinoplanes sp. NPDC026623]|uniref:MBL fold metallo-hydrolase n=1 Tax=Actinoplanes sp. NPDC026623 TaxID=3155610 RepID=UPI0033DD0B0F
MGAAEVEQIPGWVTLLRAPNPGPMTLDGTNTWVLRAPGEEFAVVIDPGPLDEGHLARIAEHGPFHFILVTHGHHDHVEGAARLSGILGGVPVLAADPRHGIGAGPPLGSGEPLGAGGLDIRVLDTPGHTADSVCFLVECAGERVVFTGDTILGRGTTVVAWPDGDLAAYLTSLGALTAYEGIPMLPGHGPALTDCAAVARSYLDHRQERLAQVRAAIAAGADSPETIVDAVYPDIAPGVRFAAEWSARAQLEYLRRESQRPPEQLDPL